VSGYDRTAMPHGAADRLPPTSSSVHQRVDGQLAGLPAHGTRARYVHRRDGCRCAECRAANALYFRQRRRRARAAGVDYLTYSDTRYR
jgi:hypothetical protein